MMNKFKIVKVVWFDAQTCTDSLTLEEVEKMFEPIKSISVGYLIVNKPEYIVLCFTSFGDLLKHFQLIPKGMIKKMEVVK